MSAASPVVVMREREDGFRAWLIDLAAYTGWQCYAVRRSQGVLLGHSAVGFPDLVLLRPSPPLLIFAELKQVGRYPGPAQRLWLAALRTVAEASAGTIQVHVWTPTDRPAIEALMTRRTP